MYDERFVTPMRQELTRLGIEEMRTPAEVDAKLGNSKGTALVVVKGFLAYVSRHSFAAFAWYRIVFGALLLLFVR